MYVHNVYNRDTIGDMMERTLIRSAFGSVYPQVELLGGDPANWRMKNSAMYELGLLSTPYSSGL